MGVILTLFKTMEHDDQSHPLKSVLMIRMQLTSEQRAALEKARRIRTSNLAERCLAVLLSDRGHRVPAIAASLGRHEHTIRSWLKAYMKDGIAGLKDTPPPGRTNRKEQAALAILAHVIPHSPSDYGYVEAGWSTAVLVDYLRGHDLLASPSTVKRALKHGGWVYKRFAKTMPAHAPSSAEKKRGWMRLSPISWPGRTSRNSPSCSSMHRTSPTRPMSNGVGKG